MKLANLIVSLLPTASCGFLLSLLVVAVPTDSAYCQVVELVADINPGPGSSHPLYLTEFDGGLCFTADDGVHGKELWKFNGSTASLVADVNPGPGNSSFRDLIVYKGELYFYGDNGMVRGLWKYDGSTVMLAAVVNPGEVNADNYFVIYQGDLYFESRDFLPGPRLTGDELWKFDGTNASVAVDIRPGPENSYPSHFIIFDHEIYFSATSGLLWKFDGTNASIAANVKFPRGFEVYNDNLYFSAETGRERELWRFDGTAASLVADINPSSVYPRDSNPSGFTVLKGNLYFSADDGVNGSELWKFDGSTASLVADINPGPEGSFPRNLAVFDGALYFRGG